MPTVVFVQFTNPAGYPPLEHASRILADAGWRVIFLSGAVERSDNRRFPQHRNITVRSLPHPGAGLALQLSYFAFVIWAAVLCLWYRPRWIYASDAYACPAALIIRRLTGARLLYHEHDSPYWPKPPSSALRHVRRMRETVARRADLCIIPQAERLNIFLAETGRQSTTLCVHNYPRKDEIGQRTADRTGALTFYYHGSLNEQRLPLTVLDALARASADARLIVVGYETIGSRGYVARFLTHAATLGLGDRITYAGSVARFELAALASSADVGLALMPTQSNDVNMRYMAGASNKPFDYLASGLMLIVTDLPDWRSMFVDQGYALACDPGDPKSLASAMHWCAENLDEIRRRGAAGQRMIANEWNYEAAFAPVLDILDHSVSRSSARHETGTLLNSAAE